MGDGLTLMFGCGHEEVAVFEGTAEAVRVARDESLRPRDHELLVLQEELVRQLENFPHEQRFDQINLKCFYLVLDTEVQDLSESVGGQFLTPGQSAFGRGTLGDHGDVLHDLALEVDQGQVLKIET